MLLVPLVGALLAGCPDRPLYGGAFDVPSDAAVLQPEVGGPFLEPVGFVANGHGGQIVPLALKQGRFLTDDRTVSYLRGNQLPTGDDRLLTSVAVFAPSATEVTLFAGDRAFGQLLVIPYVLGVRDGDPIEPEPSATLVAAPPSVVPLIAVKNGYTTTERWTLIYDPASEGFVARGSRSGPQAEPVRFGEPWSARERRLNVRLIGSAAELKRGDEIVIDTRSGLTEIDVGGAPLDLALAPDQSVLAMIVQDEAEDRPRLWWFDPVERTVTAEVGLPAGARPHRLAWGEGGNLFVADASRPAAYEVAPGATDVTEYVLPWPTLDVDAMQTPRGPILYAVPLDGKSFWLVDRASGDLIDVNALVDGVQGLPFNTPILGIEAMRHEYRSSELSDDGIAKRVRAVAIADASGAVVFAHEDTGCLVQDLGGPRSVPLQQQSGTSPNQDVDRSFDDEAVSGPTFWPNASNDRAVLVHQCAGIARDEVWNVVYDQAAASWRVEGTLSGDQQAPAFEEQRYLSDNGEVSFTIRSGSLPPQDGWTFTFTVEDGVAEATGNLDPSDSVRENSVRVPTDPVYFFYRVGLTGAVGSGDPFRSPDESADSGASWYPVDVRPFVLVPGGATNLVGRVNPQIPRINPNLTGPEIEVAWD